MAVPIPVQYRQAQRADIPHMVRIWAIEKGEGGTSEERMTAYFDGTHNPQMALPPRIIYVAQEGDALIGYIAGHLTRRFACDGELEWLYVIPERRRAGVASGLMPWLAVWFKQQNATRVCVNVAGSNTVALRFYDKHGAEPMKPGWMTWNNFAKSIEEAPDLNHQGHGGTQRKTRKNNSS
jgi:GNAT superfamily N-acetyltransferase